VRRLHRILLNAATVVSLVPCVTLTASYSTKTDFYWLERDDGVYFFRLVPGGLSVGWGPAFPVDPPKFRSFAVPLWPVALGVIVLPSFRLCAWFRRRAGSSGATLCPTCDYDLRATPERCPECGTMPAR
jgi:hypothetical protein